MIPRSMVRVGRQRPHSCSIVCQNACLAGVATWMRSNRMQLNTAKTEVIWCSSTRRQHHIPQSPLVVAVGSDVLFATWEFTYRFRSDDADARRKDCFELFCGVETASQHPAVCVRYSPAVTCRGIGADEARLRQCHIGRTACRSA